jgi:7-cyano-7-deazaguanine tRNA-ribosyltransferase
MDFYISWSHSDPIYHYYFDRCNVLISPYGVNGNFNLGKWFKQPNKIIIDCGAYSYLNKSGKPANQTSIFKKQMRIIKGLNTSAIICHLDHPINPNESKQSQVFLSIERTIGNAYEFNMLLEKNGLKESKNIKPLAAIQGCDSASLSYCAEELKRIGFRTFGLGSLARLYNPNEILQRVKTVANIVGAENLHLFGFSRLDIIKELKALNLKSIDSSRPMKAAIHNSVFYSAPFRTYGISGSKNEASFGKVLHKPLPCFCPACLENPNMLLQSGHNRATKARAIHNYHHLVKQFTVAQLK